MNYRRCRRAHTVRSVLFFKRSSLESIEMHRYNRDLPLRDSAVGCADHGFGNRVSGFL